MATAVEQQNNILKYTDVDENAVTNGSVINNNNDNDGDNSDKDSNEVMETSCGNIKHNRSRDDSSEKDLRDINPKDVADYDNVDGDVENAFERGSAVEENFLESNDEIKTVRPSYSGVIDSDSEEDDIAISSSRNRISVMDDDLESVISNGSVERNDIKRKKNETMAMDNDSINGSQCSTEKEDNVS